ncbi:hypothetical protein MRA01_28800 [Methylobacterium radiotolerans]|nr:hypothetical protein MRA01_28800 [Methylobacterium radiotolerans]
MDYGKAAEVGPFLYEWEFSDIALPAPAPACGPFLDRGARAFAVGTTANARERPRTWVAGPGLAGDLVGDVLGAALTDAHGSVDDASDPAGELQAFVGLVDDLELGAAGVGPIQRGLGVARREEDLDNSLG